MPATPRPSRRRHARRKSSVWKACGPASCRRCSGLARLSPPEGWASPAICPPVFATANLVEPGNSFFRTELGGGALNHRGVYPISLAIDLLGPAELVSRRFRSHRQASTTRSPRCCGMRVARFSTILCRRPGRMRTNSLSLLGTEGSLRFSGPIYRPFGLEITPVRARRRDDGRWNRTAVLRETPLAQGLARRLDGGEGLARQAPPPVLALYRQRLWPRSGRGDGSAGERHAGASRDAARRVHRRCAVDRRYKTDRKPATSGYRADRSRAMQIGVIGCGYVFDHYMSTLRRHPDLRLTGVADIDPVRAERVGRHYGPQSLSLQCRVAGRTLKSKSSSISPVSPATPS